MTSYRVNYTEIKPGGVHVPQSDVVNGTTDDVVAHLDRYAVLGGSISVTEYTESDSVGRDLGGNW